MESFLPKQVVSQLKTLEKSLSDQLYRVRVTLYGVDLANQMPVFDRTLSYSQQVEDHSSMAKDAMTDSKRLKEYYFKGSTLKGKVYGLLCECDRATNREIADKLMSLEPETFRDQQKTIGKVQTYMSVLKNEGYVEIDDTEGQTNWYKAIKAGQNGQ